MRNQTIDLTEAQHAVLELVLAGNSNREIAEIRDCSIYTIAAHMTAVRKAYGVGTFRQLVAAIYG